ncbi:aromatic-ring-hydroxylating dioxygenase subunit beta [Acrocarpospora macrocephala]|uniref:Aromatic-ring-hydroxylating dioxygenase subunit beta n=1 Tax=Acrocarpospora macrocephala TaxID=150177 RepID=A0A5M3WSA0_9ACTN|nr:aromatic-ring-hydroxylating dioxygenase subunit beta [Acrocarpospora macrocephala]GES09603.1 aromatic-ring-hydroxylating dioxygenase subunit beta [Acrocarpospora macrocephala]
MTTQLSLRSAAELRLSVEDFLYHEAALLDAWQLDAWVELFIADARYEVPSTDRPHGGPADALMLISDTRSMISARVKRLNSRKAHREFPWSRTRRLITNVRVRCVSEAGGEELEVKANFAIYRSRRQLNVYVGEYTYRLVVSGDTFKIRFRRAELDQETLNDHGTLSIVL